MVQLSESQKSASPEASALAGWLLLLRIPVLILAFVIGLNVLDGTTRLAFFNVTAAIIPVLLLALALESRLLVPGTGPGAADLGTAFSLLLVLGWGEAASLRAVANGHAQSGDGRLVAAVVLTGFVGVGLAALTADATPPTSSPAWIRRMFRLAALGKGHVVEPEHCEDVKGVPGDQLLLGTSSWNSEERSLKYAWPDRNGKRARGGEMPVSAIPQAVLFAARTSYLTPAQVAEMIKGLVDVLAEEHER